VLGAVAAFGAASLLGCRGRTGYEPVGDVAERRTASGSASRAPALFVGHGSPMTALDPRTGGEWAAWTASFPKPKAVLVVSAHFELAPLTIGATTPVDLIDDFYGFPDELYAVTYRAPGAPALADTVERRLKGVEKTDRDPERGLDHGAWAPLVWMYRAADVPVLTISMPTDDPRRLVAIGRALAPLRDEGVAILGSGNVTHNLGRLGGGATPGWASEFDAWCAEAVAKRDLDAFVTWRSKAPAAKLAHPTTDHFTPLLVVLGAALDDGSPVRFPITGFEGGSISRRCVQFG
jgi:4,5-DOPA dioxygenase extradiol